MIEIRRQKAYTKHPKWRDGERVCLDCEKTIFIIASRCKECFNKTQIGTKRKLEHNGQAAYQAIHNWVKRRLGKPNFCTSCGDTTQKYYEWANISKKYKRELSDWMRLCVPCHRKFDKDDGTSKKDFTEKMRTSR